MAGTAQVGVNASVGAVGASPHLCGSVHLDVLDNALVGVKALQLGVALDVLQQLQENKGALLGPSPLRPLVVLALSLASHSSAVATERNNLLLVNDVIQIALRLLEGHSLYCHCGFPRVFVVDSQVRSAGLARLGWVVWFASVLGHFQL